MNVYSNLICKRQTLKQPRCSSTSEWILESEGILPREPHSATEWYRLLAHVRNNMRESDSYAEGKDAIPRLHAL